MWTINHVHQRQSVSLQVIKSFTFKIKSRPNQVQRDFSLLTSLHSCQASILTIQELPTFVKGFDLPTSLDAGVASRHWSQLSTFHTLFLSLVGLVVTSGQHSHIHLKGSSCCLKTALPFNPVSSCCLKTAVPVNLNPSFHFACQSC